MGCAMRQTFLLALFIASFLLSPVWNEQGVTPVHAKRRVHVSDDLHDVEDNEEDEEWKEWGKPKRTVDPAEADKLNAMKPEEAVMHLKNKGPQSAPTMVFVKLRLDGTRSAEGTAEIVKKWKNLLRNGGLGTSIFPVDQNTLLFNVEFGQDVEELKEFVLSQEEAYEMKIGDKTFRRDGDLSMEELAQKEYEEKQAKKSKKKSKKVKAKKEEKEEL